MSRRHYFSFWIGLAILLISWSCSSAPGGAGEPVDESPPPASATVQAVTTAAPTSAPQPPAILERRYLTLEYPPVIRSGDSDVIRVTLDVDRAGYTTPTVIYEEHEITGQPVEIPDLYETHNVMAFARLDMAGVTLRPNGESVTALARGKSVYFTWSVAPLEKGTFRGTVWVGLRFVPLAGGEASERMLAAMPLEVRTATFFGLSGPASRVMGAVGSFLGAVLGFPFVDDLLRWLWKRLKKGK